MCDSKAFLKLCSTPVAKSSRQNVWLLIFRVPMIQVDSTTCLARVFQHISPGQKIQSCFRELEEVTMWLIIDRHWIARMEFVVACTLACRLTFRPFSERTCSYTMVCRYLFFLFVSTHLVFWKAVYFERGKKKLQFYARHLHLSNLKKNKRPSWEQRMYSRVKKNHTNKGQLKCLGLQVHFISKHVNLVF